MKQPILTGMTMIFASAMTIAGSSRYTATLVEPLPAKLQFVSNGNAWTCEGTSCALTSIPSDAGTVQACRDLQRKAGAVSGYGTADKPFDADKLAKCNAKS